MSHEATQFRQIWRIRLIEQEVGDESPIHSRSKEQRHARSDA
jgi:hypothetical protein